ncbi:MAG: glycosyltransferase [Bacillota bacterium]|nr:glycosyltransferase [Bacillota bacterium]
MKKKILFVVWSFSAGGGAEKILANIVNGMDKNKYDIDVLELVDFGVKREPVNESVRILQPLMKIRMDRKLSEKLRLKFYEFALNYYPAIARRAAIKDNYDVEISFNYLFPSFITTLSGSRTKKVAWVHGSIQDLDYKNITDSRQKRRQRYLHNKQKKAFEKSDKIVAISSKTYNSIVDIYPESKDKIVKIHNGFNFNEIYEGSNERVDLGINKDVPVILGVGRLDKGKNFGLLIRAARLLKEEGLDFKVLILGEGDERQYLEKLIAEFKLEDSVQLKGFINNPYPYFKNATLFCMTSTAEGFPTVIAEAMVLGCPFVSTAVAGAEELAEDGKCGLVEDWNENRIAKSIKEIILNKKKREDMSGNCIDKIAEFTVENQVAKLQQLLDKFDSYKEF